MPNYDFQNLSPIDFEELVRDLLQKHRGIDVESFTTGKDGGIDLRFSYANNKKAVVQCKRYRDYSDLKSSLKKELLKISKLNPDKYYLFTSVGLTPPNKDEIVALLSPYISDTEYIYGREKINNLLGQYRDIEKQHFKLWLPSINILDNILNADVINRSEFEETRIRKDIMLYVKNDSYQEAIDILNENNYTIISGIPGIGKTLLAKILVCRYLEQGYKLIYVSKDIGEADRFADREKVVFFYDDFLGRNFLEDRLNKNEDHRLVNFIRKISESKNSVLIMTTREYILNQAKLKYDIFTHYNIDINKCIVDLSKYTKTIRSKILYNHLFFNNLPAEYIGNLLNTGNLVKLINHENYNPRIVEFMTQKLNYTHIPPDKYSTDFIGNLENPINIWHHSFSSQISPPSKYILYVLLMCRGPILIQDLEEGFNAVIKPASDKYNFPYDENSFHNSMKELDDSFIKIYTDQGNTLIEFNNPSISDYLIRHIGQQKDLLTLLVSHAVFCDQFFYIFTNRKYNSGYKINIDDKIESIITDIFIKNIQTIRSSNIHKSYINYPATYNWTKSDDTLFAKLKLITFYINISKNYRLKELIIASLNSLTDEQMNEEYAVYETVAYLVSEVYEFIKPNFPKYLGFLIRHTDDINKLKYLSELRDKDTKVFDEVFAQHEMEKKIHDILYEDIHNTYYNADKSLFEGMKEDVDEIERLLDTDLMEYREALDEKINESNDDLPSQRGLDSDYKKYNDIDDDDIIDMFKTLT